MGAHVYTRICLSLYTCLNTFLKVPKSGTVVDGLHDDLTVWGTARAIRLSYRHTFNRLHERLHPNAIQAEKADGALLFPPFATGTHTHPHPCTPRTHSCMHARTRTHACTHTCAHTHVHTSTHNVTYPYTHTPTHLRTHTRMHMCAYVDPRMHGIPRMHANAHAQTCAHVGREAVNGTGWPNGRTDKMMLNNCNLLCRLDEMRAFDGTFSEGAALNGVAWTGIRNPTILWTYALSDNVPALEKFFQAHMLMDVYPMAPMPKNDHSINPGSIVRMHACE